MKVQSPRLLDRRRWLRFLAGMALAGFGSAVRSVPLLLRPNTLKANEVERNMPGEALTLFLSGDVMTGRGIDQVLPHPSDPRLYEPYVESADVYLELAEAANGPIPKPVPFDYIWGDALRVLVQNTLDVRLINLETAVTTSAEYWPGKGIHYRMHPANIACLEAAQVDCCVLANNHVLDWGYAGLDETLQTLHGVGIKTAGAGAALEQAQAPARIEVAGKGRVLVFALGAESSGIPPDWAAAADKPGVHFLQDLSRRSVHRIAAQVEGEKRPGDIVVLSLHWGGNWGYRILREHRTFAHRLIEEAGVDVVYGHSSHHPKGIEVYQDRLIIYGCGDFLNDYEGIRGYESFRDDLTLMYLAHVDPLSGRLSELQLIPMQIRRFRLNRVSRQDYRWLSGVLNREGQALGTRVEMHNGDTLALHW